MRRLTDEELSINEKLNASNLIEEERNVLIERLIQIEKNENWTFD